MSENEPAAGALFDPERDVVTEASRLQVLAHPLRLRMLGLLRLHGPSTATRLAQRCGESSGLTSYHLRQLAGAGFVEDAEPADLTGLETHAHNRWWKAARRSTFSKAPPRGDTAAEAASEDYQRVVASFYSDRIRNWLTVQHTWPRQWQDFSTQSDVPLRLSPDEARQLRSDMAELLARYRRHDPALQPGRDGVPADALIVAMQYQIFPDPEQESPVSQPAADDDAQS